MGGCGHWALGVECQPRQAPTGHGFRSGPGARPRGLVSEPREPATPTTIMCDSPSTTTTTTITTTTAFHQTFDRTSAARPSPPVPFFSLALRSAPHMSLVSGPGRGGGTDQLPQELSLFVDKHVSYIQSLDTVRLLRHASPFTLSFYNVRRRNSPR